MEPEGSLPHSQVPATILSQLNPVHTPISYSLKIHLNTMRTGDANLRFFCVFALQFWKMDDTDLRFNTRLVFTHLITQ
jgi:hypothetical protein